MGKVKCVKASAAEFAALAVKDPDTIYCVNDSGGFDSQSLDTDGLIYLGDKLLSGTPATPAAPGAGAVHFVKATGSTSALTGNVDGLTQYSEGLKIVLYNYCGAATTTTVTLNLNSLGARRIYRHATTAISALPANSCTLLTYIGSAGEGKWLMDSYVNTTYNLSNNFIGLYCVQASAVGVHATSLCAFTTDGKISSFTTTGGTGTGKAPVDLEFPIGQDLFYKSDAIAANAQSSSSVSYYVSCQSIDIRHSMNYVSSRLHANTKNDLYMKVQVNASQGTFKPIQNETVHDHIVTGQELESDCFYIYIGSSYGSTKYQIAFSLHNTLYCYDGTRLIEYDKWRQNYLQNYVAAAFTNYKLQNFTDTTYLLGDDSASTTDYGDNGQVIGAGRYDVFLQATLENTSPDKPLGILAILDVIKVENSIETFIAHLCATQVSIPSGYTDTARCQCVSLSASFVTDDADARVRVRFQSQGVSNSLKVRSTTPYSSQQSASSLRVRRWTVLST